MMVVTSTGSEEEGSTSGSKSEETSCTTCISSDSDKESIINKLPMPKSKAIVAATPTYAHLRKRMIFLGADAFKDCSNRSQPPVGIGSE